MKKFDAKMEVENIIYFIRHYYKENNLGGAIIGISGGKDSAVAVALMVMVIGKENVIGVTMPCRSKKSDLEDAKLLSNFYNFELINFNLDNVFDVFKNELKNFEKIEDKNLVNSDINLKPRLRMATLYYLAAMYSSLKNKPYIVVGTSNKSEIYVGYFTKGGDNVCDISLLADYTVEEVIKLGKYLKVPSKILYKEPNDGLSNQTDEEKLGVKYVDVAKYMKEPKSVDKAVAEKIFELHNKNKHKFIIPVYKRKSYNNDKI